ncbi:hypothetical protein Btru_061758 [Bulinus truncatus]|nr:hypothetical protein Btru_061758 [Bulinus truncatus]
MKLWGGKDLTSLCFFHLRLHRSSGLFFYLNGSQCVNRLLTPIGYFVKHFLCAELVLNVCFTQTVEHCRQPQEQFRMSSNQHPFLSSSSFIFTKSGSYITDINSVSNRTGVGNIPRQIVTDFDGETEFSSLNEDTNQLTPKTIPQLQSNGTYSNGMAGKNSRNGHVALLQGESISEKSDGAEESKQGKLKFSEMSHRSKYTLLMLAVANFGAGCAYSLPAPFFPREATKKGVSSTVIGLVFSCYQLVTFLASPFFGNFITHIGAKFTYVAGIIIAGVCAILFGFLDKGPSGTIFVVMSFIVRSVEAVGVAAFSTASFAIVSNEFPTHIGSVFAILETCIGIGLLIGPTIGGALYEIGGFGLPFWIIGVIICCSGLTIMTCLPQPQDNKKQKKGSVFSLLRSMMVWVACLSVFAGACGIAYLDPTLSDHLDQFGLSTLEVGLFFIIAPGLHALMAPVWGFISDRKDIQSPLLIIGNLVCAIGFLLVGPTPLLPFLPRELWVVTLGLILFGFTIGCSIVPTMKCVVVGARDLGFPDGLSTFGLVSGLFNATFCLGAFVGPTIGGALIERIGFAYGSTIISGFYLFVMTTSSLYFGIRRVKRHHLKTSSNEDNKLEKDESEITERSPLILDKAPVKTKLTYE